MEQQSQTKYAEWEFVPYEEVSMPSKQDHPRPTRAGIKFSIEDLQPQTIDWEPVKSASAQTAAFVVPLLTTVLILLGKSIFWLMQLVVYLFLSILGVIWGVFKQTSFTSRPPSRNEVESHPGWSKITKCQEGQINITIINQITNQNSKA